MNDGDWICADPNCGIINFARRLVCYRCNKERIDSAKLSKKKLGVEIGKSAAEKSRGLFNPDDWQCSKCANVNWARRLTCNVCNAPKFGEEEARTGYGGGYNERGNVEYRRREPESDDEYDEFGRRKKKRKLSDEVDKVGVTDGRESVKVPPTLQDNENRFGRKQRRYEVNGYQMSPVKDHQRKTKQSGNLSDSSICEYKPLTKDNLIAFKRHFQNQCNSMQLNRLSTAYPNVPYPQQRNRNLSSGERDLTHSSGYETAPKRFKRDYDEVESIPKQSRPVMENRITSTNGSVHVAKGKEIVYTLEERVKIAAWALSFNNCKLTQSKFEKIFNKQAPDFKTIFEWRQQLIVTGCLVEDHSAFKKSSAKSSCASAVSMTEVRPIKFTSVVEQNKNRKSILPNPDEIPIDWQTDEETDEDDKANSEITKRDSSSQDRETLVIDLKEQSSKRLGSSASAGIERTCDSRNSKYSKSKESSDTDSSSSDSDNKKIKTMKSRTASQKSVSVANSHRSRRKSGSDSDSLSYETDETDFLSRVYGRSRKSRLLAKKRAKALENSSNKSLSDQKYLSQTFPQDDVPQKQVNKSLSEKRQSAYTPVIAEPSADTSKLHSDIQNTFKTKEAYQQHETSYPKFKTYDRIDLNNAKGYKTYDTNINSNVSTYESQALSQRKRYHQSYKIDPTLIPKPRNNKNFQIFNGTNLSLPAPQRPLSTFRPDNNFKAPPKIFDGKNYTMFENQPQVTKPPTEIYSLDKIPLPPPLDNCSVISTKAKNPIIIQSVYAYKPHAEKPNEFPENTKYDIEAGSTEYVPTADLTTKKSYQQFKDKVIRMGFNDSFWGRNVNTSEKQQTITLLDSNKPILIENELDIKSKNSAMSINNTFNNISRDSTSACEVITQKDYPKKETENGILASTPKKSETSIFEVVEQGSARKNKSILDIFGTQKSLESENSSGSDKEIIMNKFSSNWDEDDEALYRNDDVAISDSMGDKLPLGEAIITDMAVDSNNELKEPSKDFIKERREQLLTLFSNIPDIPDTLSDHSTIPGISPPKHNVLSHQNSPDILPDSVKLTNVSNSGIQKILTFEEYKSKNKEPFSIPLSQVDENNTLKETQTAKEETNKLPSMAAPETTPQLDFSKLTSILSNINTDTLALAIKNLQNVGQDSDINAKNNENLDSQVSDDEPVEVINLTNADDWENETEDEKTSKIEKELERLDGPNDTFPFLSDIFDPGPVVPPNVAQKLNLNLKSNTDPAVDQNKPVAPGSFKSFALPKPVILNRLKLSTKVAEKPGKRNGKKKLKKKRPKDGESRDEGGEVAEEEGNEDEEESGDDADLSKYDLWGSDDENGDAAKKDPPKDCEATSTSQDKAEEQNDANAASEPTETSSKEKRRSRSRSRSSSSTSSSSSSSTSQSDLPPKNKFDDFNLNSSPHGSPKHHSKSRSPRPRSLPSHRRKSTDSRGKSDHGGRDKERQRDRDRRDKRPRSRSRERRYRAAHPSHPSHSRAERRPR